MRRCQARASRAAAVIIAELLGAEAGGLLVDLDHRCGRPGDPVGVDDAPAAPDAAVEIGLADLEQVARPHERTAAEIAFAVRRQVPVVAAETERDGHLLVEILRQPGPRRLGQRAADQVDVGRAISVAPARIVHHRQVERIFPPVGLRVLRQQSCPRCRARLRHCRRRRGPALWVIRWARRDLVLARVRIGERAARAHQLVDPALRRDRRALPHRDTEQHRGEGLAGRADVVGRVAVVAEEILLEHQLAVAGDQHRMDQARRRAPPDRRRSGPGRDASAPPRRCRRREPPAVSQPSSSASGRR